MTIDTYSYSNIGGRECNEDSFGYNDTTFVIADGLGGHQFGEVASAAAVEYIMEHYHTVTDLSERNRISMVQDTNRHLLQLQQHPSLSSMRTTLAAAFIHQNKFATVHLGDSRIYYFRDHQLYSCTKDHSLSQIAVDLKQILPEDIRFHDDRNKLLKVLGDKTPIKLSKLPPPLAIQENDAFLLCTDGFWEHVYEVEMEIDLIKTTNSKDWITLMLKRLLLRSENKGDNYTVIGARIPNLS